MENEGFRVDAIKVVATFLGIYPFEQCTSAFFLEFLDIFRISDGIRDFKLRFTLNIRRRIALR